MDVSDLTSKRNACCLWQSGDLQGASQSHERQPCIHSCLRGLQFGKTLCRPSIHPCAAGVPSSLNSTYCIAKLKNGYKSSCCEVMDSVGDLRRVLAHDFVEFFKWCSGCCDLQPPGGVSTVEFGQHLPAEETQALLKRYRILRGSQLWATLCFHIISVNQTLFY